MGMSLSIIVMLFAVTTLSISVNRYYWHGLWGDYEEQHMCLFADIKYLSLKFHFEFQIHGMLYA